MNCCAAGIWGTGDRFCVFDAYQGHSRESMSEYARNIVLRQFLRSDQGEANSDYRYPPAKLFPPGLFFPLPSLLGGVLN